MIESDYTTDFSAARKNMVEHQIRCCKVLDGDLLDMLETMPRDAFLPENIRMLAYMEAHAPLIENQQMLTPLQEALILQQLQLQGDESVLLIGAGSGYMTMLLAMHSAHVTACEIHAPLVNIARNNLSHHGVNNADVLHVNAMDEAAMQSMLKDQQFDVVIIAAAVQSVPKHLASRTFDSGQRISFIGKNPLVTLRHEALHGEACITSDLLETTLKDIEGTAKKRILDF